MSIHILPSACSMETKLLNVFIRSKDEEIELVPEGEFFRDAPKEISKPVSTL